MTDVLARLRRVLEQEVVLGFRTEESGVVEGVLEDVAHGDRPDAAYLEGLAARAEAEQAAYERGCADAAAMIDAQFAAFFGKG